MRRARDPKKGLRLPFEVDPGDREGSYRRPVRPGDAIRLTIKVAAVIAAGIWWKLAIEDRTAEGAKFLVALGAVAIVVTLVDLVAMRSGHVEQIFLSRRDQFRVRIAVLIAGVFALTSGFTRMTAV